MLSDLLGLFSDDWRKIPANFRLLFLIGGFLIFNSWLLDHWDSDEAHLFWGHDIRNVGYSIGLTLILLCFVVVFIKQVVFFKNLLIYRRRYSLSKLNKDFFLTSFRGYVVLFDKKNREYHHVVPFETAQDLMFVGNWNHLEEKFPPKPKFLLQVGSSTLHHEFRFFKDGGPINTRTY